MNGIERQAGCQLARESSLESCWQSESKGSPPVFTPAGCFLFKFGFQGEEHRGVCLV